MYFPAQHLAGRSHRRCGDAETPGGRFSCTLAEYLVDPPPPPKPLAPRVVLFSDPHLILKRVLCSVLSRCIYSLLLPLLLVCRVCLFSLTHTDAPCCALVFSFPNSKNNYLN